VAVIRRLIFGLAKVFLLVSALLALVAVIAWFYPEKFLCVDSGPVSADALVVLGGGVHERPVRAAELFQQHAAPRILLTGAGDDVINLSILRKKGVPLEVIQRESDSLTTRENAIFSIKRLRAEHVHSVILVTTWYHARRALKTFEHFAPDIKFYSRPSYYAFDREDWSKPGNFKRMRLEFLKLPGYWLRYGVNPF
jgi:uncharacterized SAM-binding protein YcdF (DUF218 family)